MVIIEVVWQFLRALDCNVRIVRIVVGRVVQFAECKGEDIRVLEKCARRETFNMKLKKERKKNLSRTGLTSYMYGRFAKTPSKCQLWKWCYMYRG
jgi:hypothetical protein